MLLRFGFPVETSWKQRYQRGELQQESNRQLRANQYRSVRDPTRGFSVLFPYRDYVTLSVTNYMYLFERLTPVFGV